MTIITTILVFILWITAVITVCHYVKKYDLIRKGQHRRYANHAVYDETYSNAVKETARFLHNERPDFILTDEKQNSQPSSHR